MGTFCSQHAAIFLLDVVPREQAKRMVSKSTFGSKGGERKWVRRRPKAQANFINLSSEATSRLSTSLPASCHKICVFALSQKLIHKPASRTFETLIDIFDKQLEIRKFNNLVRIFVLKIRIQRSESIRIQVS